MRNASALARASAEAQHRIDNVLAEIDSVALTLGSDSVDGFVQGIADDEAAANRIAVRFIKALGDNRRGDVAFINRTEAEYWLRRFAVERVEVDTTEETMRVLIIQPCPDGKVGEIVEADKSKAEAMVKAGVARLPSVKDLMRANKLINGAKLKGGIDV